MFVFWKVTVDYDFMKVDQGEDLIMIICGVLKIPGKNSFIVGPVWRWSEKSLDNVSLFCYSPDI